MALAKVCCAFSALPTLGYFMSKWQKSVSKEEKYTMMKLFRLIDHIGTLEHT